MAFVTLFQGMLGLRRLIQDAIDKDQVIAHYITHVGKTKDMKYDLFEITVFAQSVDNPEMKWAHKFVVKYDELMKTLNVVYKMIAICEKRANPVN